MNPLRIAVCCMLAGCANPAVPTPVHTVSHAFTADTGGFCRLHFQITTNAQAGASFTVLLDSLNGNYPPQFTVQFRQDTTVDFIPARHPPYWAFWQLYFTVPGTALAISDLDSLKILAPPAC